MTLAVVGGVKLTQLPPAPVAIAQGGTGAITAPAGLSALGGLDNTAHGLINHSAVLGVPAAEAFTSGVHSGASHVGITGVGPSFLIPFGDITGPALEPYGSGGVGAVLHVEIPIACFLVAVVLTPKAGGGGGVTADYGPALGMTPGLNVFPPIPIAPGTLITATDTSGGPGATAWISGLFAQG